uniref:Uncharacterized protein n=1 Tax=Oryza meridionalis TaxID=40149 RepID=A0A0E0DYI3_9ORYZ
QRFRRRRHGGSDAAAWIRAGYIAAVIPLEFAVWASPSCPRAPFPLFLRGARSVSSSTFGASKIKSA